MKLFDFKITSKEWKNIIDIKKLIIVGLSALVVRFVILAPFTFLWEGWLTVISAISAVIMAEFLG